MREVWACGVNFWKKERVFRVKLKERAEAAPSRYCATGNFSQYIFSVLVAKNYQKIRSRSLVHEIPSEMFLGILVMVTEQLYWRKIICGYLRFIWLLIAVMKWCTERCTLQLYRTSLSCHVRHGVKVGPGPRDPGPRDPRTRNLGPPSKFKSGTLKIIFLHRMTYFVLDNMEISFHE